MVRRTLTGVIEFNEDVVKDERNRFVVSCIQLHAGEPQSKIELVPRTIAHAVERDAVAGDGTNSDQHDVTGFVPVEFQTRER